MFNTAGGIRGLRRIEVCARFGRGFEADIPR